MFRVLIMCLCTLTFLAPAARASGAPPVTSVRNTLDAFLFAGLDDLAATLDERRASQAPAAWLTEPELRIAPERNRANIRTEAYSLRLRPRGRAVRNAENEINNLESRIADIDQDEGWNEVIAARYEQVIDLADLEVRVALTAQEARLNIVGIETEQARIATSAFSAARLQTLTLRRETHERELATLQRRVERARHASVASILRAGNSARVSARLLMPAQIESVLTEVAHIETSAERRVRLRHARARERLRLQEHEDRFRLDLIELSYEDRQTDAYGMTFGFRLPVRRSAGLRRRHVDVGNAEHALRMTEQLGRARVDGAARTIAWRIDDYRSARASLDGIEARLAAGGGDATTLLMLHEQHLRDLEAVARAHIAALRELITLLEQQGILGARPLRNWLANPDSPHTSATE